ncbi:hypothetical protein [Cloacibacterium normanense]|uniref:hypothetical protein n=1 Tax=Cloacibacterium normanense TaxID=237258 RepID=UPI00352C26AB
MKRDSLSAVKFLDSLAENNYYLTKILNVERVEKITKIVFDKGKNFNEAKVKFSSETALFLKSKPEIFTKNLDSLKQVINQKYTDEGFAFNRVKIQFLGFENDVPKVEISIFKGDKRVINGFVLQGFTKVPKRFIKNLEKEFVGKTYDDVNLLKINSRLENHPFLMLEKTQQTLFTKDSTQIYLTFQKKKSNNFDGIIGFGNNDKKKFSFTGSINLNLKNVFNSFETISLYWQRNQQSGQNFDLQTDIPYLFGSNIGANLNMNIYRQDSTFANVKFRPALYFHLSSKQKIGARGNIEISSVLDDTYTLGQDFSKKGIGAFYEFTETSEEPLFVYKTKIIGEADLLSSFYQNLDKTFQQTRYFLFAERNFHLKGNHYFNVKAESAMLDSDGEITTNELFRIGGYNSFRGFNEQSLFTDFYAFAGIEYRYLVSNQAFFDVFGQLANVRNSTLKTTSKLYSFGLGFNFLLPIGLMTFQISNGQEFNNPFKFQDTKIHWGIISKF